MGVGDWRSLFTALYRAGWPYQTPADIDRCYVWQIASLFADEERVEVLLDPDGNPITPSSPEVMEARMARWEAFKAREALRK